MAHSKSNKFGDLRAYVLKLPSVWTLDAKIEYLIEGMIPLGGVTMISADSGTGKSWLGYAMAGAVAHGRFFGDRATKQRMVIVFDAENPLAVVKRNLAELGIEPTDNLKIWGGWNDRPPCGPATEELLALVREHHALLIFDSLIHFHPGDEQSASDTRQFMDFFRGLANAGATVIVLHHKGKDPSKSYRGSTDLVGSVDAAYELTGTPRAGKLDRLFLRPFKIRIEVEKFGLQFRSGQGFEPIAPSQAAEQPQIDELVPAIINRCPNGINGRRIAEEARVKGLSKHAVEEFLKTWPNWRPGKGREKLYCALDVQQPVGTDETDREAA